MKCGIWEFSFLFWGSQIIVSPQTDFGDKKINIIKEVRTMTSLALKEAKELVESVPTILKEGLSKEEADSLIMSAREIAYKDWVMTYGKQKIKINNFWKAKKIF